MEDANNIPEAVTNAFRAAASGQAGALFLSFPQDVTAGPATAKPVKTMPAPKLGAASDEQISAAIAKIHNANLPVVLVGMKGGRPEAIEAVRRLLRKVKLPFVETYQASRVRCLTIWKTSTSAGSDYSAISPETCYWKKRMSF